MNIGQTQTASISARQLWNSTGIQLTAGEQYSMSASGKWVDWFISHGPDGDPSDSFYMKAFEPLRRMKDANWFELIGAVTSKIATAFPIGSACHHEATTSGELTCFANDLRLMYFNNSGAVQLTVTEL